MPTATQPIGGKKKKKEEGFHKCFRLPEPWNLIPEGLWGLFPKKKEGKAALDVRESTAGLPITPDTCYVNA